MRIETDYKTHSFQIIISDEELKAAFKSRSNLQQFMHTITVNTYGKEMADNLFPLKELHYE